MDQLSPTVLQVLYREMDHTRREQEKILDNHSARISRLELVQLILIYAFGAAGLAKSDVIADAALKFIGK